MMMQRVSLVTGATTGIGYVTARTLAERGGTVVLVGRNAAKAQQAVETIRRKTGNDAVEAIIGDLATQEGVRHVAAEFAARHDRLHVLVNNAGAYFTQRETTADGLEKTFALNHFAPFLLTALLRNTLVASAPARVVTVASMAHLGQRIPFDDINHEHMPYRSFTVYGQSKLANILFTYELARRLTGTGVTANTLHPGFVASNFGKSNGGWTVPVFALLRPFQISTEQGAQTSIYLASSPEVAGVTGAYFVKQRPVKSSAVSYNEDDQHRLWDLSERLTGVAAR